MIQFLSFVVSGVSLIASYVT